LIVNSFNTIKVLGLSTFILFFTSNSFAQESTKPNLNYFDYKTFHLSGSLNSTPVFNSNSPEIVKTEGILLSTFSPEGKSNKEAHLDKVFSGEFDIFTHHIAVEREKGNKDTLHQGILIKNISNKNVKLKIKSSSTYNSQPNSPFKPLHDFVVNDNGLTYSGPGDRVSQDILRNKNYIKERNIQIKPNDYYLLMDEEIKIDDLSEPINGRTSLFKLETDGDVCVADLALYEKGFWIFKSKPNLQDWINILNTGNLSEKRDKVPSPLNTVLPKGSPFIYGRVSGVAIGNKWSSRIAAKENELLNIPESNKGYSFVLNTLYNNTLGTKQNQSAIMEKRYNDTAYQAHANYGITYDIDIPLYNHTDAEKNVEISFDSPVRIPENKTPTNLSFYDKAPERINFRGEFKIKYKNELNEDIESFIHIVQRFGQKGNPLVTLNLKAGQIKKINISYIYPADATPPHVLTISTK
jgi:hypothetical protein